MKNPDSSGKANTKEAENIEKASAEENGFREEPPSKLSGGEENKPQALTEKNGEKPQQKTAATEKASQKKAEKGTDAFSPQHKNNYGGKKPQENVKQNGAKKPPQKRITEEKGETQGEEKPKAIKNKAAEEKKKPHKKGIDGKWILTALILTLALSFVFSVISELIIMSAPLWIAYAVIVVLVFISVLFDIVGTAITACDMEPFLAMAARKVKGAKRAVYLAKHANRVSSICSDIIGDVCGILSGSCGAVIVAMQFVSDAGTVPMLLSIAFSSVLAAITVTGKAVGKQFAIGKANSVILSVGKLLCVFSKTK